MYHEVIKDTKASSESFVRSIPVTLDYSLPCFTRSDVGPYLGFSLIEDSCSF